MTTRRRLLQTAALSPAAAVAATGTNLNRCLAVVSVCQPGHQTGHQRRGSSDCSRRVDYARRKSFAPWRRRRVSSFRCRSWKRKSGARIAELLHAPAAMVTCGAASAIAVGTAACLSQGDPAKLRQLPNRDGIRFEVIQQKSHRSGYEHQMELCGAKYRHRGNATGTGIGDQ